MAEARGAEGASPQSLNSIWELESGAKDRWEEGRGHLTAGETVPIRGQRHGLGTSALQGSPSPARPQPAGLPHNILCRCEQLQPALHT